MGGHAPDVSGIISHTPRPMPTLVKVLGPLLLVLGIAAAGYGFTQEAERARGAFIVNFMYWAGISQGALMLAVASVIVGARWTRPLKRMGEAFALFMVPMYLLLMAFLVGGGLEAYPWHHWAPGEAPPHKAIYLTDTFFVARLAVGLGFLILLNLLFIRASLRADLGFAASRLGDKAPSWWSNLTSGWRGDEVEIEASQSFQRSIAPVVALTYALVFSMVAIDVSMSLAPYWYANMFPAWYFMSCMWSGLVYQALFSLSLKKWMGAEHLLKSSNYHDLGKLTFGLTMFWAYTLFAQYLPIWYGNMTEEIGFILLRTEVEPWATLSKVTLALCFPIPFTMLLSRGLKKTPVGYFTVATILAIGIWLERFTVVMPSIWKGDNLPMGFTELGMTAGFLGFFMLFVVGFLSRVPTVVVSDPFLAPNPEDVHVLPKSQAHAH